MASIIPPRCAKKFRPQRELASGGFGTVWLAVQEGLERPVALKVLHAEALADADVLERFLAEARLTASLRHPHIVVVLDHGVDDGVPWIAYEFVPGHTLREELARAPMSVADALRIAAQVASALEEAHDRGVLHRDIKPENVLMVERGRVKIADFGIAKSADVAAKTRDGLIVGTPGYIAPERIGGAAPSARGDVYAVGALLYEMVTGLLPFAADGPLRVMERQLKEDPAPPSALVPRLSPAVDRVVLGALARDPEERVASARDLRQAIERVLFEVAGDVASVMTPQRPMDAPVSREAPTARARLERTLAGEAPSVPPVPVSLAPRRPTLTIVRAVRPVLLTATVFGLVLLLIVHTVKRRRADAFASPAAAAQVRRDTWRDPVLLGVEEEVAELALLSRDRFQEWRAIGGHLSISNPNATAALKRAAGFHAAMEAELPRLDRLVRAVESAGAASGGSPFARLLHARLLVQQYMRANGIERARLFHDHIERMKIDSPIEFVGFLARIEQIPPSGGVSARFRRMGVALSASLQELAGDDGPGTARVGDLLDDLRRATAWLCLLGRAARTDPASKSAIMAVKHSFDARHRGPRAEAAAKVAVGIWAWSEGGTVRGEAFDRAQSTLEAMKALVREIPAAKPGVDPIAAELRAELDKVAARRPSR